jgi:hypothetical protein
LDIGGVVVVDEVDVPDTVSTPVVGFATVLIEDLQLDDNETETSAPTAVTLARFRNWRLENLVTLNKSRLSWICFLSFFISLPLLSSK